ncbi:hypothetical protein IAE55_23195 [Paenibacillus sp. S28]|nr:hypothetical protein [Paenibacillus sp. S28]
MFGKRRSESGSVSIFLIGVLAMIFAFVALFIDYARIAAMKAQSERLVRAAVRSVMSSYDPELQERYGLFAHGSTSGDQIMAGVLNSTMDKGDRSDRFDLLPLQLDTSSLKMERMLGEYDIFNREVSEEMKYKAPIDFSLELVSRFKPLSESMKEASDTVDVLGKLQKLYDKREEALDQMLAAQRKAGQSLKEVPVLIMSPAGGAIPDQSLGSSEVVTAADIAAQYEDYVDKVNQDANRGEDEEEQYSSEIREYNRSSGKVISRLQGIQSSAAKSHAKELQNALEYWEEARSSNDKMKEVIAEAGNRGGTEGYDQVGSAIIPGAAPEASGSDPAAIHGIRDGIDQLLLSDSLLQELNDVIKTQKQDYSAFNNQLSTLLSSLAESSGVQGSSGRMKNEVIRGVSAADRYVHDYAVSGSGNKLDRVAGQLQEHRGSDKERKEKEKLSKAKLSEAAGILESINKLDQKVKQHNEEYQELQQYYDDSLTFNKEDAGSEYKGTDLDHDPYDAGKSAMKQTDSVYGSMAGMMSGIKDELFQNEYAALYFTHFDLGLLKEAAASPGSRLGDAVADEMSVSHQELEYIVYGFHNPVGNVSAAYAEIFAARLAVRTMEGLVKNSKLGNPLLVLAAALLYGVEMAMADMVKLCREGSVELSSYVKIQMTYRDYLRLFLLIHSDNEKKMSRMLALIRLNTGINPAERATYASGEVRIGMRLWFLPGVIQMAGYAGGSPDNVEGNRYYVTKKADFAY